MSPTATSFSFVSNFALRRITRWPPHVTATRPPGRNGHNRAGTSYTTPVDVNRPAGSHRQHSRPEPPTRDDPQAHTANTRGPNPRRATTRRLTPPTLAAQPAKSAKIEASNVGTRSQRSNQRWNCNPAIQQRSQQRWNPQPGSTNVGTATQQSNREASNVGTRSQRSNQRDIKAGTRSTTLTHHQASTSG